MKEISNQYNINLLNLFKSNLENSFGFGFQNIFHCLMKAVHGGLYDTPQPTGKLGDYGNDGYIGTLNWYFAIYGPHTRAPKAKEIEKKFGTDFEKRLKNSNKWPYKLKKFTFVTNLSGKIEGIAPNILSKRDEYQLNNQGIKIEFWTQHDIINLFANLDQNKQLEVLRNSSPSIMFEEEFMVNASIIEIITTKLIDYSWKNIEKTNYNLLKFDEKIKLNNLNDFRKDDLSHAAYYIKHLDYVLEELNPYSAEDLSKAIKVIYLESTEKYNDENFQFDYILSKLIKPDDSKFNYEEICNKKMWIDNVLIIMAKYFENCTIFKSEG